jgi:hypothetical protein
VPQRDRVCSTILSFSHVRLSQWHWITSEPVSGLRRMSSREYDARLLILALLISFSEYVAPVGSTSLIFNFLFASFLVGGPVTGNISMSASLHLPLDAAAVCYTVANVIAPDKRRQPQHLGDWDCGVRIHKQWFGRRNRCGTLDVPVASRGMAGILLPDDDIPCVDLHLHERVGCRARRTG